MPFDHIVRGVVDVDISIRLAVAAAIGVVSTISRLHHCTSITPPHDN